MRSLSESFDLVTQYPVLDFIGLVEQHGYTGEEYNVTTDDGYILRLHRISGSPSKREVSEKPVVYLQHGIGLSSDSWVLVGPQKDLESFSGLALRHSWFSSYITKTIAPSYYHNVRLSVHVAENAAFLLADSGYDVWLGNVRGNAYSRSHLFKSPNDPDFWEFSYHEMAIYDVQSFIDRILEETGTRNLTYYGYSMGTTLSYVLLSNYPEYNAKINLLHSVAPVAFWRHELKRLMSIVDAFFEPIEMFIEYFKLNELLQQTALAGHVGNTFCGDDDMLTQQLCVYLFSNIGLDFTRFNKSLLPNILAHFPAGTSKLTVYHYNQNFKRKTFQAYDYGAIKNVEKYGRKTPPFYDLTKVTVSTKIYYGKSDDIVNKKDVFLLAKRLPNLKEKAVYAIENPRFNHFDFLWASDAKELLYDSLR